MKIKKRKKKYLKINHTRFERPHTNTRFTTRLNAIKRKTLNSFLFE